MFGVIVRGWSLLYCVGIDLTDLGDEGKSSNGAVAVRGAGLCISIAFVVELRNGAGDGIRFDDSVDCEATDDPAVESTLLKLAGGLDLVVMLEMES